MGSMLDKAKGAVKEAVGKAVDDRDLEAEGKLDQAKGHAKEAFENVKHEVKRAAADAKDLAAEKLRRHAADAERNTDPDRD